MNDFRVTAIGQRLLPLNPRSLVQCLTFCTSMPHYYLHVLC